MKLFYYNPCYFEVVGQLLVHVYNVLDISVFVNLKFRVFKYEGSINNVTYDSYQFACYLCRVRIMPLVATDQLQLLMFLH